MEAETDMLLRAVDKTLGVKQASHQIESATLPKMESFLRELDELLTDDLGPRSFFEAKEAAENPSPHPLHVRRTKCWWTRSMKKLTSTTFQITTEENDLKFD